jgi:hypothetical protein
MLNAFITSQKQNEVHKFMQTTASSGNLLLHFITAKRVKVSDREIMVPAVCSKCEKSEQLMRSGL